MARTEILDAVLGHVIRDVHHHRTCDAANVMAVNKVVTTSTRHETTTLQIPDKAALVRPSALSTMVSGVAGDTLLREARRQCLHS